MRAHGSLLEYDATEVAKMQEQMSQVSLHKRDMARVSSWVVRRVAWVCVCVCDFIGRACVSACTRPCTHVRVHLWSNNLLLCATYSPPQAICMIHAPICHELICHELICWQSGVSSQLVDWRGLDLQKILVAAG